MSTVTFSHELPFELDHVWAVHSRPGIVHRLMPGFTRFRTVKQADSLRDGVTVFALPAGLRWTSEHQPDAYVNTETRRSFTDVCVTPGLRQLTSWRHEHTLTSTAAGEATRLTDTVTTNLPVPLAKRALGRVFAFRHRRLEQDLQRLSELQRWAGDPRPRTVAVTGATGLVGTQLCALLSIAGHTVVRIKRDEIERDLTGVDAVVHLGGHPIAGRFTDEHLAKVRDSRVEPTRRLAANAARCGVSAFVCASAVGFYGCDHPTPADESADQGNGELASIVSEWEAACQPAREAGLRVVNVRSGLVLAGGSPMLDALTASVRLGGGHLGSGEQHFAWVALDDVVDIYARAVMDASLSGPINAVAPHRVTNDQFTRTLATVAHGLPLVPVPRQAPALLLGARGAKELALADQNVVPAALERAQHRYRFPTLEQALRHELGATPIARSAG